MTSFLEQEANHFHPPLNLILQPLLAVITNVKILPKGSEISQALETAEHSFADLQPVASRCPVQVDEKYLNMEVDTGALVSLISERTWQDLCTPKLNPAKVILRSYSGESVKVLGEMELTVQYQDQKKKLNLLVVTGGGTSHLGCDWLQHLKLNWCELNHLQSAARLKLEDVLKKHADVFKEELGKFSFQFSEWAAPIVPVCKPNGSLRICGDYKVTVNKYAKTEEYPLPRIEDLVAALLGGQEFTKLDLANAYLQLPLEDKSMQYVTINTYKELFKYNRLPFGVASAPAIFQRTIECLLQGMKHVVAYIDDILITGEKGEDHLKNLDEVQKRLGTAGMRLKVEKCLFQQEKVEYLGQWPSLGHKFADGREHPVAFVSRTLAPTEKNYSQLDKEGLAIIFGVEKFHNILFGRQLTIFTDHKPLKHLFGKDNANADVLSRLPLPEYPMEVTLPGVTVMLLETLQSSPVNAKQIAEWMAKDPVLSKVKKWLSQGWTNTDEHREALRPYRQHKEELSLQDGCILWGSRVVVPEQDYAGPFMGKMFLLIMDTRGKWLEAQIVESATSAATIQKMKASFASHGLPVTLVSDDGSAFTSQEFEEFLTKNGVSPAELLMGRRLRSHLSMIHPGVKEIGEATQELVQEKVRATQERQKKWLDKRAKPRSFFIGINLSDAETVVQRDLDPRQQATWSDSLSLGSEQELPPAVPAQEPILAPEQEQSEPVPEMETEERLVIDPTQEIY
eukprot:Em0008g327a